MIIIHCEVNFANKTGYIFRKINPKDCLETMLFVLKPNPDIDNSTKETQGESNILLISKGFTIIQHTCKIRFIIKPSNKSSEISYQRRAIKNYYIAKIICMKFYHLRITIKLSILRFRNKYEKFVNH
jgi:hypothetical protein